LMHETVKWLERNWYDEPREISTTPSMKRHRPQFKESSKAATN
jgi:hypothetical protein